MATDSPGDSVGGTGIGELALAYLDDPTDPSARSRLVSRLRTWAFAERNVAIDRALVGLAGDDDADHQRLVDVATRHILASQPVPARSVDPDGSLEPSTGAWPAQSLDHPLVRRILEDHIFVSPAVERIITALRSQWLRRVLTGRRPQASDDLLVAVALQMQTTEWVYNESPSESEGLASLAVRLSDPSGEPWEALVYAMYRPLDGLLATRSTLARLECGHAQTLLRRHFDEREQERSLVRSIPRLTDVRDGTSRAVRDQYEERPYPRWRRLARPTPRRVGDALTAAIADPGLAGSVQFDNPEILIAGCGTGRHAVATALRHPTARVTAFDLSLSSLAYASRQALELGVPNVEFQHADLLELDGWGRTFDIVEAVGVLHHLANPERGWAVLHSLMRPGSLMKVGLYSARGRSLLDPVTRHIASSGIKPDREGTRAVRSFVAALPGDNPLGRLATTPDFFSFSGCRDMFFHAHEDRFDLGRVQRALEAFDLEFLGFELPSRRVRSVYREWFPDDDRARDLGNWDALERAHPLLFVTMYRFWVRARPARETP
jgi:2-polyprenyl-3-methyl-5-hydroxy-6-metoxy-1,4-benzoquinol methylase